MLRKQSPAKIHKMEIHFFTGKGGVGKSAVAAAQAVALTRKGKKTLLVELGERSYFKDYFSLPKTTKKDAFASASVTLFSGDYFARA